MNRSRWRRPQNVKKLTSKYPMTRDLLPKPGPVDTMSVAYFIFKNGYQSGPFTFRTIARMQQAGAITVTDPVRRDDEAEWHPIGKIRDRLGRATPLRSNTVLLGALGLIAVPVVWVFAMICWMYS